MKSSGNMYQNYPSNQNNQFASRHMDFTSTNPNSSGYGKNKFKNLKKSQYNRGMMSKTRSTKQLLRSKKQSTNHAQNDIGKIIKFLI